MRAGRACFCELTRPFLNTFYFNVIDQEIEDIEREAPQVHAEMAKDNMKRAMEQMEYLELHRDFQSIKAESINRFVANEQLNLKKHIQDRAAELLASAKSMEARNRQEIINRVMKKVVDEVESLQKNIPVKVLEASFEAALDGIATGIMDYKKDIVLPMILERVRVEVSKLQNLSEEEQKKLVMLSEAQIEQLRNQDDSAKQDYLKKQPMGIDGTVRGLDGVKQMYAEW